jgi:F-box protein 25/32
MMIRSRFMFNCFHSRKYGLREDFQYTEVLALCRFCTCLFWPSMGHPCISESPEFREKLEKAGASQESQILVPPQQFLKYFSL